MIAMCFLFFGFVVIFHSGCFIITFWWFESDVKVSFGGFTARGQNLRSSFLGIGHAAYDYVKCFELQRLRM